MNLNCSNQDPCPVILDSKCVIYEGENLLYIGVNTNDNFRVALQQINTTIGNLILSGGITQLTGDVSAYGPGVAIATLATVNANVGQFGSSTAIPKITVNAKGLVTAISTESVLIPSGSLNFIGDVTGSGNTGSSTTLTLATVNSNIYTSDTFLKFSVNGKGLVTAASAVVSGDITAALGYTPYNSTNPSGFISGINSMMVTSALGYTPYNASNPAGYISGITSSDVTIALGFTPYNATNPSNFISRLALSASAPLSYNNSTGDFAIQLADATHDGYLSDTDWNTFNNKQASGNYITDLSGEASATGPGSATVTLSNAAVTGKVLTGVNITGGSVVDTDTMLTAFGKLQNQINSLIGSSIYKGTWDAATNTPTLTSSVGTRGWYYIVNVYGTTNLDGITDWHVGDWAIFDGTVWQKVDTTDAVVSVNGFTGAVSLTTDNISEGTINKYFTNTRARQAFSAGTGMSYDDNTGIFSCTITQYTDALARTALSAGSGISYDNLTGTIANTAQDQIVSIGSGSGISVTGTYPNFTVTSTITQYTDALARASVSLTTSGSSGAATYNNTTGVFNIPDYGSSLAAYVPYTGASTNVNLGSNTITAGSIIKAGGTSSQFLMANGSSNSNTYLNVNGGTLLGEVFFDVPLRLKNTVGLASPIGGYSSISANGNGYYLASSSLNFYAYLNISALGNNRTFTFPDASGTIALTSNLSSYVPTSRTLTINGVGYDLSADRSWTVTPNVNATYTQDYTATAGQTVFTVTGGYTVGQLAVFYNGSKLAAAEYTATNGTSFTLATACQVNDILQAVVSITGGGIGGSGTTNYISKWTASGVMGNSLIYDNGTNVGIGTSSPANLLHLAGASSTPSLRLGSTSLDFYWDIGRENLSTGDFVFNSAQGGASSERMRITTGGNVGIGTTSIANGTAFGGGGQTNVLKLSSIGYPALEINTSVSGGGSIQFTYGSNLPNQVAGLLSYNYASGTVNELYISNNLNGSIVFNTNGAERMRITSDGSMGFNTSALSSRSFSFKGVTSRPIVLEAVENAGVHSVMVRPNNSGYNLISSNYLSGSTYLPLSLSARENTSDLVLTNGGLVYVGATSMSNGQKFGVVGSGVWDGAAIGLQNTGTGGQTYTMFSTNSTFSQGAGNFLLYNAGGAPNCLIVYSNGNYAFGGSNVSDRRLKQDIEDLDFGLGEIMKLSPKSYHLKSENNLSGENIVTLKKNYGFIAQEMQDVLPEIVTGKETETEYLGLDYNSVLAVAVKAIQELKAEIEELKAKIN